MNKISLILVVISGFLTLPVYAQQAFPFLADVVQDKVNVRAGQSENFERISQLNKGDQVVVVDKDFSWYKIQLDQTSNVYISAKYVNVIDDATGEVTGDNVNVRSRPSVDSSIVSQLSAGAKVKIVEKGDEWHKIKSNEESFGWVRDQYLTFNSQDIYAKKEMAIVEPPVSIPTDVPALQEPSSITLTGVLQPANDAAFDYKLKADRIYYLKGMSGLLDRFLNYTVEISGELNAGESAESVVTIQSAQLVF